MTAMFPVCVLVFTDLLAEKAFKECFTIILPTIHVHPIYTRVTYIQLCFKLTHLPLRNAKCVLQGAFSRHELTSNYSALI